MMPANNGGAARPPQARKYSMAGNCPQKVRELGVELVPKIIRCLDDPNSAQQLRGQMHARTVCYMAGNAQAGAESWKVLQHNAPRKHGIVCIDDLDLGNNMYAFHVVGSLQTRQTQGTNAARFAATVVLQVAGGRLAISYMSYATSAQRHKKAQGNLPQNFPKALLQWVTQCYQFWDAHEQPGANPAAKRIQFVNLRFKEDCQCVVEEELLKNRKDFANKVTPGLTQRAAEAGRDLQAAGIYYKSVTYAKSAHTAHAVDIMQPAGADFFLIAVTGGVRFGEDANQMHFSHLWVLDAKPTAGGHLLCRGCIQRLSYGLGQ